MLEFLYTVPVTVSPANQGQVDLSQLDTIAGAIGGAIVVLLVMLIIGFFLIKFKVVSFSNSGKKEDDPLITVILKNLNEKIDGLREEIKVYSEEHKNCSNSLNERFIPRHDLERTLDEIRARQIRLREEVLPRDYVRQEQFREMVKRIESIDDKLDTLLSRTTKEN